MDALTWPLTSLQRRMIQASTRDPGLYVIQDVCRSLESFDLPTFQRAWRDMASRHPILRSRIVTNAGGEQLQEALDRDSVEWRYVDWSAIPEKDVSARLQELLHDERQRPFDFLLETPARFALVRAPSESVLVWTVHHTLVDGRSCLIAWRELFGEQPVAEPESFGAYARFLSTHDWQHARQYWRENPMGECSVLDRLAKPSASTLYEQRKESRTLSAEFTPAATNFAAAHEVTVGALIQAAWAILLSRYLGTDEVLFGVTRSGRRSFPRAEEIVGPLINTIPFRVRVEHSLSVSGFIHKIRGLMRQLRSYESVPLDLLLERAGKSPFNAIYVYEHITPQESFRTLGGAWNQRIVTRYQRTDAELTLAAYGAPSMKLDLIYNTALFTSTTAAAMIGHLEAILRRIVANGAQRIDQIDMLTAGERDRLLADRPSEPFDPPCDICAHQLFEQQARRTPNATAIEENNTRISYEELNRRANRVATLVRERGCGPEDKVALFFDPSADAITAVLGILKAGAAFVPIHPGLPAGRVQAILDSARPKAIVTTAELLVRLKPCGYSALTLESLSWSQTDPGPAQDGPCRATPNNAAYLMYTSGSTGTPKGVVINHSSLVNHTIAAARTYGITACDRRLQFANLAADMFIAEIFNYLCHGATLVCGAGGLRLSAREFLGLLEQHRITISGVPSSFWKEWSHLPLPRGMRALIVGMEHLDAAAVHAWKKAAPPGIRMFNAYGPTETCLTSAIYEIGASEWESASFVPIGKSLAHTRMYVLDASMHPVPAGLVGELYIGGAGVGRHYCNAPELTDSAFIDDPFRSGERLFRTGDLGFVLPDGNFVFASRADRQVKVRGFRVELDEIEVVLGRHPGLSRCAVVMRNDNARPAIVGYGSPAAGCPTPTPAELRHHLARYLPSHMIPAALIFLDDMPLTPSGKVDRLRLPALTGDLDEGDPPPDLATTETERILQSIWREILKREHVTASQDFFEAGGDSLAGVQLLLRIRDSFHQDLPFAALLRAPTIAQLARLIDERIEGHDPLIRVNQAGSLAPLFAVTASNDDGYIFRHVATHLPPDQPMFVMTALASDAKTGPVEKMAAALCSNIREISPEGPYILAGYCFGGVMAFEAAQQLIADGHAVQLVIVIDTPTPGYPKVTRTGRRYRRHLGAALSGAFAFREAVEHAGLIARLVRRRAASRMQRAVVTAGIGPGDLSIEQSIRMYTPRRLPAPVALLLAEEDAVSTRILDDPRLGWSDFTDDFTVHRLRATHRSLLAEDSARDVARCLVDLLTPSLNRRGAADVCPL